MKETKIRNAEKAWDIATALPHGAYYDAGGPDGGKTRGMLLVDSIADALNEKDRRIKKLEYALEKCWQRFEAMESVIKTFGPPTELEVLQNCDEMLLFIDEVLREAEGKE